jgi:hypothetical protein
LRGAIVVTRREAWLSALAVLGVALVVRWLAASVVVFPRPEDTAYYVGVAENLLTGRGLVSDALWSYQTPPLVLPRPAFEVWMPLPTWLAAIPMALLGPTFPAAQVSSVVVGAAVPVLAWRLAADVAAARGFTPGRRRVFALGSGLTAAVYLPLVLHSALPDSTMPFTALALLACLLMSRIARSPEAIGIADPRVIALGLTLGLAALTRNEAAWLALTWVIVVFTIVQAPQSERVRLVGVAGVVALLVFVPWAVRNFAVFGSPLPGQAAANALSITGFDIFAWHDQPSVERYLAVGPLRLVEMRVEGLAHNLFSVLLLPGFPVAPIGLIALPWIARMRALRPVVLLSLVTFLFTSLVFPVATTWGTFLHAAGPVHVLLILSALLALDRVIERVGVRRGWNRPVAWLGPALTIFGGALFSFALLPSFGAASQVTMDRYAALEGQMAAAGMPLDQQGPVITNFPIWLSEATGAQALALPNEPPRAVVDLARQFEGTRTLIVVGEEHGQWPDVLEGRGPGVRCFEEIDLGTPADPAQAAALGSTRAWEIVCR